MIKRFFAFLILGIFITFKCFTWVPTAAVTGVPAIDALEYTILQTIGMATQNGVEFDFTDDLADIIHDVNVGTYSIEYGLKQFLKGFAEKLLNSIPVFNGDNQLEFISGILSTQIGMPFGVSNYLLQDISRQFQNKCLDNSIDIITSVSDTDISFWNKYRTDFINDYLDLLNDVEVITYPEDPTRVQMCSISSPNQSSITFYCSGYDANGFSFDYHGTTYNNLHYPFLVEYDDGDTSWDYFYVVGKNLIPNDGYGFPPNPNAYWYPMQGGIAQATINTNYPIFFNITDAVNYSQSGHIISGSITADVPNAVIDENSDDGKIVSNPIYWVVDGNTGTNIDAGYNLDSLAQLFKDIISGQNTKTTVGFDDLVDAGAIVDSDGNTLTDADISTKSVADVISDATTRTGDLSITAEIAGVIPPLPILPTFSAGPQGDPTAGFRGMSILARIINVTNRGLPEDLIVMFYGIVACLIVLGLIKVLHK